MKSKAEVVRTILAGKRVIDVGGVGFGADNEYEREMRAAWDAVSMRYTVDANEHADYKADLNQIPLPDLTVKGPWDCVTFFDVLEHLERPVDVLRWVPAPRILVTLPNCVSPITRRMEKRNKMDHLYSFTMYTAQRLLERAGWRVLGHRYIMGKWSLAARLLNFVGSICPAYVATGILLEARRE